MSVLMMEHTKQYAKQRTKQRAKRHLIGALALSAVALLVSGCFYEDRVGGQTFSCQTASDCAGEHLCAEHPDLGEGRWCISRADACSDGLENVNETGKDCGGPDCDACVDSTCGDGELNGDESALDCGGSCATCAVMIEVAEGEFSMGSASSGNTDELPVLDIFLSAFSIDRDEVTVAEFQRCVELGPCTLPRKDELYFNWGVDGREQHPINGVTWFQAEEFCFWAGKRLPTEAEWEKAARGAGEGERMYPWGDAGVSCDFAVMNDHQDNKYGCGDDSTWPVGSRSAGNSPYGVRDMAGNVWEWTNDGYGEYSSSSTQNPRGFSVGTIKVLRGGSFSSNGEHLRAAGRDSAEQTFADFGVGFRCARSVEAP